ncbi:dolichyl-phosphate-mannose--protein mannosyltransferase [Cellulomonas sp. SG140]|uniref:dolichyl-phosphate-mannose--protein mannosyltransferase n=1 Tax=Cellulomonas sp. SG140 TaxID=2976536 RepID=UPI0021E94D2F|nr:phospholipid carrier-dependent glycosyltransferase [Cellulomonas sp. SG140]
MPTTGRDEAGTPAHGTRAVTPDDAPATPLPAHQPEAPDVAVASAAAHHGRHASGTADEAGNARDAAAGAVADAAVGERDADEEPTLLRLQRRLFSDAALALDATRRARLLGWLLPLAVTAFGGIIRFWRLAVPHNLVFDETYYVKEAYSLLVRGYEASWGQDPNPRFEAGDVSMLQVDPEYVVHPPVGKWMIGLGIQLGGGVTSSFAWRLSVAVCGTLAILMIARIGRRLFASTALGTLAGLFLAVDGQAIVHSRVSLLDPFLMFFCLAAFGFLLLDRDQARHRLAVRAAAVLDSGGQLGDGPGLGIRWWRLAAAVSLGLAIGTKWSGMYFLALFGLMSVAWDMSARRAVGVRHWVRAGIVRDGVVAGFSMVLIAAAVYLASWTGWFLSKDGWGRQWAAENPGQGVQWLPPALRSLWKYHQDMWHFHVTLETPHAYQANPLGWIVQWRATSYFYPTDISGLQGSAALHACGAKACSQAITALGNPLIWWGGAAAALVAVFWLIRFRDWRAGAVLSGIVAGWFPWFMYMHRTIFTFYSVAFVPWVVLTLVYLLGLLIGPQTPGEERSRSLAIVWVSAFATLVVAVGAFFYPVWTAWVIPYDQWHLRMWLQSWV